jgi:hypothetical protein
VENPFPLGGANGVTAMKVSERGAYDPETITLLRSVLDAAWDALPPEQRATSTKSRMASCLLSLAARGERDPIRLRSRAVMDVVAPG